jgi:hypothetical protein
MMAHCTGHFRVNGKLIAPPQTTSQGGYAMPIDRDYA